MKEYKEKETGMAITYSKLKRITNSLDKMNFKNDDLVSFEYIIGSCFPNVYDNIQRRIKEAYTQGYVDGLKEKEVKEIKEEKEYLN